MNIVIIEIKKPITIPQKTIQDFCDNYARFCQEYEDSWVILAAENVIWENHAHSIINEEFDLRFEKLNKFAFNRLISNLEERHPEVSLIMMGAGEESKLIKVRQKER